MSRHRPTVSRGSWSRARRILVIAVLSAAAVVVTPSAAFAAPTGCTLYWAGATTPTPGAAATCTGGTGQFRAYVDCYNEWTLRTARYYGPWTSPGYLNFSYALCTYNFNTPYNRGIQLRN